VRTKCALQIFRKIQTLTQFLDKCGATLWHSANLSQTFERAFLHLKNAEIRIKIELQMATIFYLNDKTSVQDPEHDKQTNKQTNKQKNTQFLFLTPPCSGGSPPNFA